jgi:chemotaxis-related protein WspD
MTNDERPTAGEPAGPGAAREGSAGAYAPCWHTIGVWGRNEPRCPELPRVLHCRNCEVYVDAGRNMLHRPPPEAYGAHWAAAVAEVRRADPERREAVMVFRAGGDLLALPLASIVEVHEWRAIRTVPHRRDGVLLGLVNIRGELCPCVSLEVLFGHSRPDPAVRPPHGRMLAVGSGRAEWIVPVEETVAIPEVALDALESVPVTLFKSDAAFVRGLFTLDDRRVGLIDAELLVGSLRRRLS